MTNSSLYPSGQNSLSKKMLKEWVIERGERKLGVNILREKFIEKKIHGV